MKKIILIVLLFVSSNVRAISQANLNGDCVVDFKDFALLADAWQDANDRYDLNFDGFVDYQDLMIFGNEWLSIDSEDRAPVIQNITYEMVTGTSHIFTIIATDTEPITYSIQSLPDVNKGTITGVNTVPHNLPGNNFEFNAVSPGTVVFNIGANDDTGMTPPCGGLSIGTVTVNINAAPIKPIVSDTNIIAIAFVTKAIILTAIDDGQPNPPGKLKYIILSLPQNGTLQDANTTAIITKTPYTLSRKSVLFTSDTAGQDSFTWKANDYGEPNFSDSNTATVTIDTVENLLDCLSFDGKGFIEIPDNNSFDIMSGWAIDFWIKCDKRTPFTGIIKKRESNGKGWEIGLVSGKPKIYCYDSNGTLVFSARGSYHVNDGRWHEVGFIYVTETNKTQIAVMTDGYSDEAFKFNCIKNFDNDANLFIGFNSKLPYKDQLDKIRFFSGIVYPDGFNSYIQGLSGRTESIDETFFEFIGKESDVLFMMDEGSGITITDSKKCLIGNFNNANDIKWCPKKTIFTDNSARQFYKFKESQKGNGF